MTLLRQLSRGGIDTRSATIIHVVDIPIKAVALLVVDALVIGLRKPTIEDYLNRLPYNALMYGRGLINRYPAIRTMLRKSMSTSSTIAW